MRVCGPYDRRVQPTHYCLVTTIEMKRKSAVWILVAALIVIPAFFDVQFRFEFALPATVTISDPGVEALFADCFNQKDNEIHDRAFGTIDNPDVQKEFISSNRAIARRECRALHPLREVTTETPLRFNIVDLQPRFW